MKSNVLLERLNKLGWSTTTFHQRFIAAVQKHNAQMSISATGDETVLKEVTVRTAYNWRMGSVIPSPCYMPIIAEVVEIEVEKIYPAEIWQGSRKSKRDLVSISTHDPESLESSIYPDSNSARVIYLGGPQFIGFYGKDGKLKGVIDNSKHEYVEMKLLDKDPRISAEKYRSRPVTGTIGYVVDDPYQRLKRLGKSYPQIDLRSPTYPADFSIFRIDEKMIVIRHVHGRPEESDPVLYLQRNVSGGLFDYYVDKFEKLFNNSVKWTTTDVPG